MRNAVLTAIVALVVVLTGQAMAQPMDRPAALPRGAWTQLTTVARIQGKWMTAAQYRTFLRENDNDRLLRWFSPVERQRLSVVALETGFQTILDARDKPGVAVAVPDKDLEILLGWQTARSSSGALIYRPQILVRVTRVRPQGPPGGPPAIMP